MAGLDPSSVLDAGCGTGRVAIELARRGIDVVGVDADESMIATARRLAPGLTWVIADLTHLSLDRRFDVVVMAGNVPNFTPPGTQSDLVAGCVAHLADHGSLVAGFQLDRGTRWPSTTSTAGKPGWSAPVAGRHGRESPSRSVTSMRSPSTGRLPDPAIGRPAHP